MANESTRVQTEPLPRPDASLEYVLYALIGLGLCVVALFVFLYGQRGDGLLRDLSKREPNAVMKEGIRQEWAGDLGAAAAAYRKALGLGFDDYWAAFGCKERLTSVLIQRGQLPELKLEDVARLDATNLLANAGFEEGDGTSEWLAGIDNTAGLCGDPLESIEGKRSLQIHLDQRGNPILRNEIAVLPGYSYRVSGWLRTVDASPHGIGLAVRSANEGAMHPRGELFLGTRDWQQFLFRFTVPDDVTRVALVLESPVDSQQGETGAVWVDQCAVVRDQTNLLKNGSFESGGDGRRFWLGDAQPGVRFAVDRESVVEGSRALRIDYPAQTSQAFRQEVEVEEGAVYRLEAWFRSQTLEGQGVQLVVKDVPSDGKTLSTTSEFLNGSRDWSRVALDITVPEGIYSLVISVHRPGGPRETTGVLWLDACSLVRQG